MDVTTPDTPTAFARDLEFAQQTIRHAVATSSSAAANSSWALWSTFCQECAVEPLLRDHPDPIPFFLVFTILLVIIG